MVSPRRDPKEQIDRAELFKELGRDVDEAFKSKGKQKNALQKAGIKLHPTTISRMIKGDDEYQWNDNNFLRLLRGFLLFDICEDRKKAKYWFQKFCTAKGYEGISLEEYCDVHGIDGEAVIIELESKEAEREQEARIEKPMYTTSDGMPVIGRDEDIQKVLNILRDKDTRLLFLVGLPGVGKSELARQVRIVAKDQGLFISVLDPLSLVQETSPDAVITSLTKKLKGIPKQIKTLVTLEDCEQVKGLTHALNRFLDEHNHVTILATSRKRMRRNDYTVQKLEAPKTKYEPIKELQKYDSVKLFLASINVNRDEENKFRITEDNAKKVAYLCYDLGGLPLMLCMAGSWVDEQNLDNIYNDLLSGDIYEREYHYNEDERHISLNSVIRWSYSKLQQDEQKLFRRLGIFGYSGCSIPTAKAVCNLDDLTNFTNSISTLKQHFLVTYTDEEIERIEIAHNTLCDFAWRELQKDPQNASITMQFLNYYNAIVIDYIDFRHNLERLTPQQTQALEDLRTLLYEEYNNFRAAYDYILKIRKFHLVQASEASSEEELFEFMSLMTSFLPEDKEWFSPYHEMPRQIYLYWDNSYYLYVERVLAEAKERGYLTKEDVETINNPLAIFEDESSVSKVKWALYKDKVVNVIRAYWEAPFREWVYWKIFIDNEVLLPHPLIWTRYGVRRQTSENTSESSIPVITGY